MTNVKECLFAMFFIFNSDIYKALIQSQWVVFQENLF